MNRSAEFALAGNGVIDARAGVVDPDWEPGVSAVDPDWEPGLAR
ncbi:hypothetical protein [Streptomyces qinzhouensis]|nr:hypothetical protein [Streptomyces qinzhouensis]